MNNNNKTIEKLVDEIIRIVDKKIAHLYSDKEAIIVSENEDSYTVLIDSYKYNVKNGTNINIDLSSLHQQNAVPPRVAEHLCRLLRLAILFASRRRDDLLPAIQLTAQDEQLTLILPGNWLDEHPLGREMVDQECQWQSYVHWILRVASGDTLK